MNTLIWIGVSVVLTYLGIFAIAMATAVEGYDAPDGFHFGKPPPLDPERN